MKYQLYRLEAEEKLAHLAKPKNLRRDATGEEVTMKRVIPEMQ